MTGRAEHMGLAGHGRLVSMCSQAGMLVPMVTTLAYTNIAVPFPYYPLLTLPCWICE